MTNPIRISDLVLTEDFHQNYWIEARPTPIDVRRFFYINGMLNTEKDSRQGACALSKTLKATGLESE